MRPSPFERASCDLCVFPLRKVVPLFAKSEPSRARITAETGWVVFGDSSKVALMKRSKQSEGEDDSEDEEPVM